MVSHFLPEDGCSSTLPVGQADVSTLDAGAGSSRQGVAPACGGSHPSLASLTGASLRAQDEGHPDLKRNMAEQRSTPPTTGCIVPRVPQGQPPAARRPLPSRHPPRWSPAEASSSEAPAKTRNPSATQENTGDLMPPTDMVGWTWPPQAAGSVAQARGAAKTPAQLQPPTAHSLSGREGRGTVFSSRCCQVPESMFYFLDEAGVTWGHRPGAAPFWWDGGLCVSPPWLHTSLT